MATLVQTRTAVEIRIKQYRDFLTDFRQSYDRARADIDMRSFTDDYKAVTSGRFPPIKLVLDRAMRDAETISNHFRGQKVFDTNIGKLHMPQIETIQHLMLEMYTNRYKYHVGYVIGPTNCGKTGTIQALQRIGCIQNYLLTGKRTIAIYGGPNNTKLEAQAREACERHNILYNDIDFMNDRKEVCGYADQAVIEAEFIRKVNLKAENLKKLHGINPLRIRMHKNYVKRVKQVFETALKNDYTVLFIMDEFHHADTPEGAQNQMWSLTEKYRKRGLRIHVICFSATPFTFAREDQKKVWVVKHRLHAGYSGINVYKGEKIDPRYDIKPPEVHAIEMLEKVRGKKVHIENLSYVSATEYRRGTPSAKFIRRVDLPQMYQTRKVYRKMVEQALIDFIVHMLGSANPIDSRQMFLRWINSNRDLKAILKIIQPVIARKIKEQTGATLRVIEFNQECPQSIRESIDAQVEHDNEEGIVDTRLLIVATAAGRMGDDFPASVGYFVDFTTNITDVSALIQGTFGRGCGHGKESVIFVMVKNLRAIRTYCQTGEFAGKHPSRRVRNNRKRGRLPAMTASNFRARRSENMPVECHILLDKVEAVIRARGIAFQCDKMMKPYYVDGSKNGDTIRYLPLYDSATLKLAEAAVQALFKNPDAKLLLPGQTKMVTGLPHKLRMKGATDIHVGYRKAEYAHGPVQDQTRDVRTDRTNKKGGHLEAQVHIKVTGPDKFEVVGVTMPMERPAELPLTGNSFSGTHIPPGRSASGDRHWTPQGRRDNLRAYHASQT